MESIIKDLYDELSVVDTVEEFKSKISEYISTLNKNGLSEIAKEIKSLSGFYENKFSQVSTFENMKQSQISVLNYIENHIYFGSEVTENIGILVVNKIMENFHQYARYFRIHGWRKMRIAVIIRYVKIL